MTTAIKRFFPQAWMAGLFLAILLFSQTASAADKVAICHLPPGNPENHQTILVGPKAVKAHLAHGDTLGACASGCQADSACDDENPCTSDVCSSDGSCSHTTVDCNDSIVCTQDLCDEDSGGCVYVPTCQNAECDDGNACTTSDTCEDGTCKGTSVEGCCTSDADCSDGDACTVDVCGTGNVCVNTPKTCNPSDSCQVAFCDPSTGDCGETPKSCDDSNICTDDSCDPASGCDHEPTNNPPESEGEVSCNDGLDNDCDGLIDGADSDCLQCICPNCMTTQPAPDQDEQCAIVDCNSGFADCDNLFATGCETDITTDSNCGGCGVVCAPYSCGGNACRSSCTSDADCSLGNYCDSEQCLPKRADGEQCDSSNQCQNGVCENNLCGGIDEDNDGYPATIDCDDQNTDVFPGAPELCDGKDNDCDNVIDEDCGTQDSPCQTQADCANGYLCISPSGPSSVCLRECTTNADCPGGTTCTDIIGSSVGVCF